MKIIKKILITLIAGSTLLGVTITQTSIHQVEATNKTKNGVEMIKNIVAPKGVEFHQTFTVDDGVYVVGTSSSKEGAFNLGGTETFPKIFVAKYTSDLNLEKITDTGYKYEYQKLNNPCTSDNCQKEDEVTLLQPGREELRFIMQIKDGILYVVGSQSTDKTSQMGCGVGCNVTEHERRIFVNKYTSRLELIKGQTFGREFSEYIKESGDEQVVNLSDYKVLFTNDELYIRYKFFANRVGEDYGILKINLNDLSVFKNYIAEDSNTFREMSIIHDIMPYGNNIAILEQREDEKEKAWYEYNGNLERQGEISKEILNDSYEGRSAYKPSLNDETFYLNSGKLYRSKTASLIREQECLSKKCVREYYGGSRHFQDESGEIYSVFFNDKNISLQLLDTDGKSGIMEAEINLKADLTSLSISGNNNILVVSANNNLYTFRKPQNQTVNNIKENCYQKSALEGNDVAFKHPKTNSCYTVATRVTNDLETSQKVLKDGKEIFNIKSLDKFKEKGVMLVHPLLAVTDDGDIIISGIYGKYGTGYTDTYYTVMIDGKTKSKKGEYIDNDIKPGKDPWKWWSKYQKVTTDGKNIIISGTRTQRYESESTPIPAENQSEVPFVLVLSKKLVLEKVLLNDETKQYLNYRLSTIELTDRYIKTIVNSADGANAQAVIYNRESKTIIEEITNDVYNEVKTADGSMSVENGKIIEKNTEGQIIKEQPISIQEARIAPVKVNNNYVVANRNSSGKVVMYLIGDDGKELRKLETDIAIEEAEVIIFNGVKSTLDKLTFYIAKKDGVSRVETTNITKLQEETPNIFLIVGISIAVVLLISAVIGVIVVIKRKKRIR